MLSIGDEMPIEFNPLSIGLQWDMLNESIDMDATCVLFDQFGNIFDAVYYNQLETADFSVVHSGDNKTGEGDGDDESISVDFTKLNDEVTVMIFVISCYSTGSFSDVETASVVLRDGDGVKRNELELGGFGDYTSLIFAMLYKDEESGIWVLKNSVAPCDGRNFQDVKPVMMEFVETIIDPMMMSEGSHIVGKSFNMKKGDEFQIRTSNIRVGLGWDTGADLDASVLVYDSKNRLLETVSFSRLHGNDGAITHMGDNLTGEGDGDDEVIEIRLKKLNKKVKALIVLVNVYTSGKSFKDVDNPFVRLVSGNNEICRYDLTESFHSEKAMIMCKVVRQKKSWLMEAVGVGTTGNTASETPQTDIIRILKNQKDFWNLRILRGRDLVSMDKNGFSDPYFKFKTTEGKKIKSKKVKKTLNPEWNHDTYMKDTTNHLIRLEIWDWDKVGKDDFMGVVSIDLEEVSNETWLPVVSREGKNDEVSGEVLVQAQRVY